MCAMTHWHVCHDSFTCFPWLIQMCAMTHSDVCHDSFYMYAMTHCNADDSHAQLFPMGTLQYRLQRTATHCNTLQHTTTHCNTLQHTATSWHIQICATKQSYVCRDSSNVSHDVFIFVFCLSQYVAVCCSVLQYVVVRCSGVVARCSGVVVRCSGVIVRCYVLQCVPVCRNVLQCVAVCGSPMMHSYSFLHVFPHIYTTQSEQDARAHV